VLLHREEGQLRLLAAGEAEELEERPVALPGGAVEDAALDHPRVVAKAVGALVGRAAVEGQAGPHPARLEGEAPAVRVEGSGPDGTQELAAVLDLEAREVDRAAVGGGPHGGRADPALDLDAVHAAREVAEIDEVQGGVLGLAQGHAVEGEVDPGLLDAPQVEVGV